MAVDQPLPAVTPPVHEQVVISRQERAQSVSFGPTTAAVRRSFISVPDAADAPPQSSLKRPSTAGSQPSLLGDRATSHYSASTSSSRTNSLSQPPLRSSLRRPSSAGGKALVAKTKSASLPPIPRSELAGLAADDSPAQLNRVSILPDSPPGDTPQVEPEHSPQAPTGSRTQEHPTPAKRGSLPPEFYPDPDDSGVADLSLGLPPGHRPSSPGAASTSSAGNLSRHASISSQTNHRQSLSGLPGHKPKDGVAQAISETLSRRASLSVAGTLSRKASLDAKKLMLGSLKEGPSLYDGINLDVLLKTKEIFAQADIDSGGDIDQVEFVKAFAGILSTDEGGGPEALRKLFMRIDANADGSVDWNEFSTYMLLENDGAASLRDEIATTVFVHPTYNGDIPDSWPHKAVMTSLCTLPAGRAAERYATTGRDGAIRVWNCKDLSHVRTIQCGDAWLTASMCTPVSKLLCVSSFARELRMYDPQTLDICGTVPELEFSPLTLDSWKVPGITTHEMIVLGDVGGVVSLFKLTENLAEIMKGPDRWGMTRVWRQKLHTDWVTQVKYVPELNSVVSCSLDGTLCLADIDRRAQTRCLKGHHSGVNAADWSHLYKFIASGSLDKRVLLWNPYSQQPMAALVGHMASVIDVVVNERNNQIISLSCDKTIKVWDIRNHRCMQTLVDGEVYRKDELRPAFLSYDAKRKWLLAGAVRPKGWPLEVVGPVGRGAHVHPVVCALYSNIFGEVVSGDNSGTVCVWNVITGELKIRFAAPDRITAMSFDDKGRRLITGSDRGALKVWNFSNGDLLKELHPVSKQDVTGIVCLKASSAVGSGFFVSVGWDRHITFYPDHGAQDKKVKAIRSIPETLVPADLNDSMRPSADVPAVDDKLRDATTLSGSLSSSKRAKGHSADILTVAHQPGTPMLATGGYDGQIFVWNTDSGAVTRVIMAHDCLERPYEERAVEKVMFMSGKQWYVLIAIGADGWIRFWDAMHGRLLYECSAGHKGDEALLTACISPDNTRLVTGDSAGYLKLWDISGFASRPRHGTEAVPESAVRGLHIWRGHTQALTSIDWIDVISGKFIVSSSTDRRVALWSDNGSHVGDFGRHTWRCQDPATWHRVVNRKVVGEELDTPRSAAASEVVGLTPRSRTQTPRPGSAQTSQVRAATVAANGVLHSPQIGSDPGIPDYDQLSVDDELCFPEDLRPIPVFRRRS